MSPIAEVRRTTMDGDAFRILNMHGLYFRPLAVVKKRQETAGQVTAPAPIVT